MNKALRVEFTALAAQHVREAEEWWRLNRPAAPNAVREELQRVLPIIAAQPRIVLLRQTPPSKVCGVLTFAESRITYIFTSPGRLKL